MIKLRSLQLKNFLSHEDTTIRFADGDKVLVDGVSGSGKSSVIDSIIWALYGVGRVENRSLVRRGAKEATVILGLVDDEIGYIVERKVSTTGKHTLMVSKQTENVIEPVEVAGLRETQHWIEHELLHASYELFINSVAYPQGNRESFVNATSARRKELLLEILKTEDIDVYADKTREEMSKVNTSALRAEMQIDSIKDQLETNQERLKEEPLLLGWFKEVKENLENAENETAEAERRLSALKESSEDRKKLHSLKTQKNAILKRKEAHEKAIDGFNSEAEVAEALRKAEADIEDEDEVVAALKRAHEWGNERNALLADKPTIRDYASEIEELEERLARHLREQPVCPAGDACPYMADHAPQEAYMREEILRKRKVFDAQATAILTWEEKIKALGSAPDVSKLQERDKEIRAAREGMLRLNAARNAFEVLQQISADLEPIEESIKSLGTDFPSEEEIAQAEKDVDLGQKRIEMLRERYSEVKGQLVYIETLKKDITTLENQLVEYGREKNAAKQRLELLGELREAFGANGVKAVALDYLLPALEDRINDVLSQLSDFRVRLDTQRSSSSGDSTVEGLFITIRNDLGEEFSYDSYSGGEKLKITVAISEALATLQNVGFRILDELFVGLDNESTDSFAVVLAQVQGRFSQMLCISHLQQIKDLFEKQISIRKINGISTIEA